MVKKEYGDVRRFCLLREGKERRDERASYLVGRNNNNNNNDSMSARACVVVGWVLWVLWVLWVWVWVCVGVIQEGERLERIGGGNNQGNGKKKWKK
jgi:hypothetical protein